jgi:glycosyltransferase involved in cell wall biosynthesis
MMSQLGDLRIALVHDELTRRGGAEVVLEEMIRLWPQADVWALYAGRPHITMDGRKLSVHTSFLQNFPRWFRRHPRRLLPFLSQAAEQLDLANYEVVISSASAFAKALVTRATTTHICYCHTPTRYLWENDRGGLSALLLHYLRLVDFAAAQRVDYFIANSIWTAQRIKTYYRRDSEVIYPPVNTTFFTPGLRPKTYFLCVGRLTPSKQFDQAIAVCEKLKLPLVIVGTGHRERRLRRLAGPYTRLVGRVSQEKLREYYRGARALLQPGVEDFGIASVEAQACGIPVIALGRGGAREAVRGGETGILYNEPSIEGLAEAIRVFLAAEDSFRPETTQRQALRFSTHLFQQRLLAAVEGIIAREARALV